MRFLKRRKREAAGQPFLFFNWWTFVYIFCCCCLSLQRVCKAAGEKEKEAGRLAGWRNYAARHESFVFQKVIELCMQECQRPSSVYTPPPSLLLLLLLFAPSYYPPPPFLVCCCYYFTSNLWEFYQNYPCYCPLLRRLPLLLLLLLLLCVSGGWKSFSFSLGLCLHFCTL